MAQPYNYFVICSDIVINNAAAFQNLFLQICGILYSVDKNKIEVRSSSKDGRNKT